MNRVEHCTSCGSRHLRALKGYERHFLTRCLGCGLVFSDRFPDQRDLAAHYDSYGRNDFLSPVTVKRYGEILDMLERKAPGKRLLDVGCGIGFFLDQAAKKEWQCFGTEISDKALNICRDKGHQVFKGKLSELDQNMQGFDVITAFEVIEHLENVGSFIEEIQRILSPGGLLYITTPNFNSLNRRLLKDQWNVIAYPEHLHYFNHFSLHLLLKKRNFKKIFLRSEGFSPSRMLTSLKGEGVDHSSAKGNDEWLRDSIESNLILRITKREMNRVLSSLRSGESLKALYRLQS